MQADVSMPSPRGTWASEPKWSVELARDLVGPVHVAILETDRTGVDPWRYLVVWTRGDPGGGTVIEGRVVRCAGAGAL